MIFHEPPHVLFERMVRRVRALSTARELRRPNRLLFLLVYCFAVVLGSSVYFWSAAEQMDASFIGTSSGISLISVLLFYRTMRRSRGAWSLLCASSLFVLGFWIVHFFYGLLVPFVEEVEQSSKIWPFPTLANSSILAGIVGLHSFLIGYALFAIKPVRNSTRRFAVINDQQLRFFLPIGSSAALAIFFGFVAMVGSDYLSGAYDGTRNWASGTVYLFFLLQIILFVHLSLEIYRIRLAGRTPRNLVAYLLSFHPLTLVSLAFVMTFQLYTGDRGLFIFLASMIFGGYDFFFKRMALSTVAGALIASVFLMHGVTMYRSWDGTLGFAGRMDQASARLDDAHWYDAPGELGGSIRTVSAAIYLAELRGYSYGQSYPTEILAAVPFFQGVFFPDAELFVSSTRVTDLINGPQARSGAGTSLVGDLYMSWGLAGVGVGLLSLGYLFCWLESAAFGSRSIYFHTAYMIVLAYSLYWGRSSFLGPFNWVLWCMVAIWLLVISVGGNRAISGAGRRGRAEHQVGSRLPSGTAVMSRKSGASSAAPHPSGRSE